MAGPSGVGVKGPVTFPLDKPTEKPLGPEYATSEELAARPEHRVIAFPIDKEDDAWLKATPQELAARKTKETAAVAEKAKAAAAKKAESKAAPETKYVEGKGKPKVQKDIHQPVGPHTKAAARRFAASPPPQAQPKETPPARVATGDGTPPPQMETGTPKPVRTFEDVKKSGKPGYVDTIDIGGRKALQVSNFDGSDDVKADLRSKGYVEIVISRGGKRAQFFVTPGDLSAIKLMYPESGVVHEVK